MKKKTYWGIKASEKTKLNPDEVSCQRQKQFVKLKPEKNTHTHTFNCEKSWYSFVESWVFEQNGI